MDKEKMLRRQLLATLAELALLYDEYQHMYDIEVDAYEAVYEEEYVA